MSETATSGRVQVPKAAELVAAQLRRQIIVGELPEGTLLPPEPKLMTDLGVSRPTLRQALRILENERIVRISRGRNGGTRVSRPSASAASRYLNNLLLFYGATLDDVHQARMLLEPAAVAELARTAGAEEVATLRQALADNRAEPDALAFRRAGEEFHVKIVELTGNRTLTLYARLVTRLLDVPIERRHAERLKREQPSDSERMLDHHERVIDLIAAGATQEAERHWREHLEAVHELLRQTVNTGAVLELDD
jgi:DNA-binding FadR family transcriptional regulator